jgi:hypothetical protein
MFMRFSILPVVLVLMLRSTECYPQAVEHGSAEAMRKRDDYLRDAQRFYEQGRQGQAEEDPPQDIQKILDEDAKRQKDAELKRAADAKKRQAKEKQLRDARTRIWKEPTSGRSFKAEFLSRVAGNIKLKKEDGSVVLVPFDQLAAEDREWVRQWPKVMLALKSKEPPTSDTPTPLADMATPKMEDNPAASSAKVKIESEKPVVTVPKRLQQQ